MTPSAGNSGEGRFEREIVDYFERRRERLEIVATTTTPSGQTLDWVPIESQLPEGEILAPPPQPLEPPDGVVASPGEPQEQLAETELMQEGGELGPAGTVPILRKNLATIDYTKPLSRYLSRIRGKEVLEWGGTPEPAPEDDGNHRYARARQFGAIFGGSGVLSCFNPAVECDDDFSLIQIGLSNRDLGYMQTVEAGLQDSEDRNGDSVPHLFVYYTTNGYTSKGDDEGGYDAEVDGWIQHDNLIFPGAAFTVYSTIGGPQFCVPLKYQLFRGKWWLRCLGRWIGCYPARLFMGDKSVFSTLGDHANALSFFGEIFDSDDVSGRTTTDMGSGRWPRDGWTEAGYLHNLKLQSDRAGTMQDFDGSSAMFESDPDMYRIEAHFNSGTTWESFVWVGGPGTG